MSAGLHQNMHIILYFYFFSANLWEQYPVIFSSSEHGILPSRTTTQCNGTTYVWVFSPRDVPGEIQVPFLDISRTFGIIWSTKIFFVEAKLAYHW